MYRIDDKLARIRAGDYAKGDFIIADAKDGDMGPSMRSCGPRRRKDGTQDGFRTRGEFLDSVEAIVRQDVVDVMLTSLSNYEALAARGVYEGSRVMPAGSAPTTPPTSGCSAAPATRLSPRARSAAPTWRAQRRSDASSASTRSPSTTTSTGTTPRSITSRGSARTRRRTTSGTSWRSSTRTRRATSPPRDVPGFVSDAMMRCLAGLTKAERPEFLKIAYNGPAALEELAAYDPSVVVGILGRRRGHVARLPGANRPSRAVRRAGRALRT